MIDPDWPPYENDWFAIAYTYEFCGVTYTYQQNYRFPPSGVINASHKMSL